MPHRKKSSTPSERRLKVYGKYLPRAWYGYVLTPEIRLCGKWLEAAGFECGQEVIVKCLGNKIEITLNPNPVEETKPAPVQKRRNAQKKLFE